MKTATTTINQNQDEITIIKSLGLFIHSFNFIIFRVTLFLFGVFLFLFSLDLSQDLSNLGIRTCITVRLVYCVRFAHFDSQTKQIQNTTNESLTYSM